MIATIVVGNQTEYLYISKKFFMEDLSGAVRI